jgi:hypothetical protein
LYGTDAWLSTNLRGNMINPQIRHFLL